MLCHNFGFLPVLAALSTLIVQVNVSSGDDSVPVLLRYKFAAGQVIRYDVSLHDDYIVKIGDLEETPHSYQDSVKNYRVLSVNDDGSAVIELMIESARLDLFQNGANARFDSQIDKKPEEIFQPIASMIGKPHLRLTISPTGDVSELKPLLNENEKLNELAVDVLVKLPEEPVKVGGFWNEDISVPLSLPNTILKQVVKLQRRHFVKSIEEGIATITIKTKVLTPLNDPELELQLMRRQPEGTIELDLQRGILLSRTLTQEKEVVNFGNGASQMSFKQLHTEKLLPQQVASETQDPALR